MPNSFTPTLDTVGPQSVSVITADYEAIRQKALEFLIDRLDDPGYFITISPWSYSYDYEGIVSASTFGWEKISFTWSGQQFIKEDSMYSYDYVGPVSGTWWGLSNPEDFEVQVYSITDEWYLQAVCDLLPDGTWNSGEQIAQTGFKVIQLVQRSDGKVVDYARRYISEWRAYCYSKTDVEYLQDKALIWEDFSFLSYMRPGEKIVRITHVDTAKIVGATDAEEAVERGRLIASFLILPNDPDYGYYGGGETGYRLEQRSWIYDDALAIISFSLARDFDRAKSIIRRLIVEQASDGSLPFSFDRYLGRVAEEYRRTGAIAWVGWAICVYMRVSRDLSPLDATKRIADWILAQQVVDPNDIRYGLCTGGQGWYDENYVYHDNPIRWCSTEHNLDVYHFLANLYFITQDKRYKDAMDLVQWGLLNTLWDDANGRFFQGVSPRGVDTAWALDCVTWGGLFLLTIGQVEKARRCLQTALRVFKTEVNGIVKESDLEHYNQTYAYDGTLIGFKPYADVDGFYSGDPTKPVPEIVWSEGTWGFVALAFLLGEDSIAQPFIESLQQIQNLPYTNGGFLTATRTYRSLPWEFHTWPSVGGTAWAFFTLGNLTAVFAPPVVIADGAAYTVTQLVNLTISAAASDTTGYEMKIWGDVDTTFDPAVQDTETNSTWLSFSPTKQVKLSAGDGIKVIYVRLRDDVYIESAVASDSIVLDTTCAVVSIIPPAVSKISKVAGKDTAVFSFTADSDFVEYVVMVVPTTDSSVTAGVQIPTTNGSVNMSGTGFFAANTPINCTITGADLEAASPGDGPKIIKVFVRDAAGNWSL